MGTLTVFGQWTEFRSERSFWRWAHRHLRGVFRHLRGVFPTLPHRRQFNRLQRQHLPVIIACALHLGQKLSEPGEPYELLDGTGVAVRNDKRSGVGWLPEAASIGPCGRLRWFEGRRLLHDFRREHERPHTLGGFLVRLAASIGLYHLCIWRNRQHERPDLAIAGLVEW